MQDLSFSNLYLSFYPSSLHFSKKSVWGRKHAKIMSSRWKELAVTYYLIILTSLFVFYLILKKYMTYHYLVFLPVSSGLI